MAKGEVIKILKNYCLLLSSSGIPVYKAFLYGSYSRNEATPDSDIDILIVSELFDKQNDMLKVRAWRLTEKINNKIEPYIIGLQKFETDNISPILQIIKKEGIEIPIN
jgi:predicted nucleotidyltransferase